MTDTRAALVAAWVDLEARGATVHRRPLDQLSDDAALGLLWHEQSRLRALTEREAT